MLLSILFSAVAFACPDLGGTYASCTSPLGESGLARVEVVQSGTEFLFTTVEKDGRVEKNSYVADGTVRVVDERSRYTVSCDADSLRIDGEMDLPEPNRKATSLIRLQRTPEGDLRLDISSGGNTLGPAICRRQ